jgi:hypothetical protein
MKTDHLPADEMKKYGILMPDNSFSKKLSEQDVENFLKGDTLIAENDKNRLTFRLDRENQLDVKVYEKGIVNHKSLSGEEIFEILDKKQIFYKTTADFGTILQIGKEPYQNHPDFEAKPFVELATERGLQKFYGKDLEEKLQNFQAGDRIQIHAEGIEKTELATENGKYLTQFDNVYRIEKADKNTADYERKAYFFDPKTNTIEELDLKKNIFELTYVVENQKESEESHRYKNELLRLKGFMQDKAEQYPEAAKQIIEDINIISNEIASVDSLSATMKQTEKSEKTDVQLNVNDYDTYEDARRLREEREETQQKQDKEEQKNTQTRKFSR